MNNKVFETLQPADTKKTIYNKIYDWIDQNCDLIIDTEDPDGHPILIDTELSLKQTQTLEQLAEWVYKHRMDIDNLPDSDNIFDLTLPTEEPTMGNAHNG